MWKIRKDQLIKMSLIKEMKFPLNYVIYRWSYSCFFIPEFLEIYNVIMKNMLIYDPIRSDKLNRVTKCSILIVKNILYYLWCSLNLKTVKLFKRIFENSKIQIIDIAK